MNIQHYLARRTPRAAFAGLAAIAVSLGLAACGGTGGNGPTAAAKAPDTLSGSIEFWHFFEDREADVIQSVVDDFVAANPDVKVNVKSGQDDQKVLQAISAGQPVDVALSYSTDQVGVLCSSGAFVDLASYIQRDGVDINQMPQVVQDYTAYKGKRCSMPALADVYGLYYNKDLLSAAGYTDPPKTLEELSDMAVKLTTYNADGSIDTLGFMPLMGYYENASAHYAPAAGAKWLNDDGTSAISSSPGWEELMNWQKDLITKLGGYQKLSDFQAQLGEEFSAENDFEAGKLAMNLDGEYRTAFIADEVPDLNYGTAPFPTLAAHSDLFGGGYITGNIIGIGKGAKNSELAWAFIKYLTTNVDAQVKLTNGLMNVPTWQDALTSPGLNVPPQFQTFLDIFQNPNSVTTPVSPIGAEYMDDMDTAWSDFQSGKSTDIAALLQNLDKQINDAVALKGK